MKEVTNRSRKNPKPQPKPPETDEERKKYFDWLYGMVGAAIASRLEVIHDESPYDVFANKEDERMEDQARRAHLFTWHLMRQRDISRFNEKVFVFNDADDETESVNDDE